LLPANPLTQGYYQVFLGGDSGTGRPVLKDLNKVPLGATPSPTSAHPRGQDFRLAFQVTGAEGVAGPQVPSDDTAATAHPLGDVTGAGLVQVAGTIGADPAYNVNPSNANLAKPAADVDLYHFRVTGSGRSALTAEVFAGRFGSPLDPALSLFQADPQTGQLQLVGANDNSFNDQAATDGEPPPLTNDAVLYAGPAPGDYYLAVSGTGNVPDPLLGLQPGAGGVFDPNVTESGSGGYTTGDYVRGAPAGP
jgi:hypothetical protein